ncbi:riboflavin kinase [Savitreella phatthalungensis]
MSLPLCAVEGCRASQLAGQQTIPLAEGKLTVRPLTTLTKALAFQIGDSFAIDVEPNTVVGTKGDRSYLVGKGELLVQLDFDAAASEQQLTIFEKIMVEHGYLLAGVQADADNISRGFMEWLAPKTHALTSNTASNTSAPLRAGEAIHNAGDKAEAGSQVVADGAGKIAGFLQQGAQRVGAYIGDAIGTRGIFGTPEQAGTTREAISDGIEAAQIAGTGLKSATTHAANAAHEASLQAADAAGGSEARKLASQGLSTSGNVAKAVGLSVIETSSMTHGVEVATGAVSDDTAQVVGASKKTAAAQRPETRPDFVDDEAGPSKPFPIRIRGEVVKGFGRGSSELGIPTANLAESAIPDLLEHAESGIYYGLAQVDVTAKSAAADASVLPMVMSVGWNPFYDNTKRSCEVHICHRFSSENEDFYGRTIKVLVLGHVRPEYNYDGLESLVADIKLDIAVCQRSIARPAYNKFISDGLFDL